MEWLLSTLAEAGTGAGAAAVGPITEYIISLVASIVGAVIVIAILVKSGSFIGGHDRENITGWLIIFLFGCVLFAAARPIAASISGFAAGSPLTDALEVYTSDLVGFLLGDALWVGLTLGTGTLLGLHLRRALTGEVRHGR